MPCIDTEYSVLNSSPLKRFSSSRTADGEQGSPLLVMAVLLDAKRPGVSLPSLPNMKRVPGAPGILDRATAFSDLGGGTTGLTAKRIGHAWLVVAGGTGTRQRVAAMMKLTIGRPDLRPPAGPPVAQADGGLCSIGYQPLSGSIEVSQTANPVAPPVPSNSSSLLGQCASAYFLYGEWSLSVDALLHFGKPGSPPQAADLRAIAGHAGFYEDQRIVPGGPSTWRKIGANWLVARGGSGSQQRRAVLGHIVLQTRIR